MKMLLKKYFRSIYLQNDLLKNKERFYEKYKNLSEMQFGEYYQN